MSVYVINFMSTSRLFINLLKNLQIRTMASSKVCECKAKAKDAVPEMPRIDKKIIHTTNAPQAVGPYSQAVVFEKTIYVSGCLGLNKDTMKLVEGGVVDEARQALTSLGRILEEAGTCYANVLKTTVFLDDICDFTAVNEVYKEFFNQDFPARSCYQVAKLPLGAKVEVEAIAGIAK